MTDAPFRFPSDEELMAGPNALEEPDEVAADDALPALARAEIVVPDFPEDFRAGFACLVGRPNADVKTVTVRDTKNGTAQDYPYDKLILSSGVRPNSLPVPGNDLKNVFLMRGYDWATSIKAKLADPAVKHITVIGAGYIGIEAAEASRKAGKEVTLLDMIDRPLGTYLDPDMTDILAKS